MIANLVGLLNGLLNLATLDKNHEVDLFKLSDEKLITNGHALKLGH